MADNSLAENIIKLKLRFQDAIRLGISNPESFQEILLQLLAECEKYKIQANNQALNLEKEMKKFIGMSEAFNSMGSVLFSIVDSMVKITEKEENQKENK